MDSEYSPVVLILQNARQKFKSCWKW